MKDFINGFFAQDGLGDTLQSLATFLTAKYVLLYSVSGAAIITFTSKWIGDPYFILAMVIMVVIDHVLGVWCAIRNKCFRTDSWGKLASKACVYMLSLLAVHSVVLYLRNGDTNAVLLHTVGYLDSIIYTFFLLKELVSINRKTTSCWKYPILPPALTRKIDEWMEKGTVTDTNGGSGNVTP